MRRTTHFKPEYSENFRCIGPACEDSCCEEWTIHVDQSTFEKYKALPAGPLRTIVDENILRISEETNSKGGSTAAAFAQICMNADRKCPLLSAGGLCQMQSEHGEAFLSHMCATYPRVVSSIGGVTEKALSLSCPEAARLVLLNPLLAQAVRRVSVRRSEMRPRPVATHGCRISGLSGILRWRWCGIAFTRSGSACF